MIGWQVFASVWLALGALGNTETQMPREAICLNGQWLIHYGGDEWTMPAEGYRLARVPGNIGGDWQHEFDNPDGGRETGWYRLYFRVPAEWTSRQVGLLFTRVGCYAKVYLDDRLVGEHPDGNTPFHVDLTGLAKAGKDHRLDVFIHGWSRFERGRHEFVWPTFMNKAAGILGDVYLTAQPVVRVDDISVITSVRTQTITVRAWVRNDTDTQQTVGLANTVQLGVEPVLDLPSRQVTIQPHETAMVETSAEWKDPQLWGFEPYGSPVLYHLATRLNDASGSFIDARYTRFGFREFWIDGDRFILNGRPIFLQGEQAQFYMHTSYGQNRRWLTMYFKALRDANVNFIRLPHGVFFPVWAEVADEVGMLLESEPMPGVPTVGSGADFASGEAVLAEKAEKTWVQGFERKAHLSTVSRWVREWRNHPSLVLWSTDNESGSQSTVADPAVFQFQKQIKDLILSMNPTRPVDHEGSPLTCAAKRLGVDLVPDIYNVHPYSDPITTDVEQFKPQHFYSGQPILIGELFNDYGNSNFSPEQLKNDLPGCWAKTQTFADYWYRNILAARAAGYDGTVLLAVASSCFWGPISEKEYTLGPYGRTIDMVLVTWPSLSGPDPKVAFVPDNIPWDSINWFAPNRPAYTPNHVFGRVKAAYREINGGDLPPLPNTLPPELIVTVTYNDQPAADAYVRLVPSMGQATNPLSIRTDADGRAWFRLDVPGPYRLEVPCRNGTEATGIDVKPMSFDGTPGYANIQRIDFTTASPPLTISRNVPDDKPGVEPAVLWRCLPVEEQAKTSLLDDSDPQTVRLVDAIDDDGKIRKEVHPYGLKVYHDGRDVTAELTNWGGNIALYPEVSKSHEFEVTMPAPAPGRYELILHNPLLAPKYPAKLFVGDESEPRLLLDTNAPDLGLKFSVINRDARHVIELHPQDIEDDRVKLRFQAVTWGTAVIRGVTLRPLE